MYKLPEEVIQFIAKTMETWRVELTADVNIQRYIPGRCTIIISNCNCDNATRSHSQDIARKDQSLNVHGQHETFCQNRKRTGNPTTVRIYSQDIGMEFGIEKCAILTMKSRKRHMTEGIDQPKQEKIRTLEEKESYKYLEILEVDTIKQVEMKEKN